MNMSSNAKDRVISLLQNYRVTKRKIEQLRYELEHPAKVSPDEVIEAMNFAKGDGEGRPSGSVSNKTLYIAMNFQSGGKPSGTLCGTSGAAADRGYSTRLLRGAHMAADQR